jgi:hypothetical protein
MANTANVALHVIHPVGLAANLARIAIVSGIGRRWIRSIVIGNGCTDCHSCQGTDKKAGEGIAA